MTLVDLLLHEIMNLVGWKRNDNLALHHVACVQPPLGAALHRLYIMLKEVVNLTSAAAELADPFFDAGEGYKRGKYLNN